MIQAFQSLRILLSLLRRRGRWCLQIVLHLWRRFTQAFGLNADQQAHPAPKKPGLQQISTNGVTASRLPTSYSLDEGILAMEDPEKESTPKSKPAPLDLNAITTNETPRRQSTSATVFSPTGTIFASSPLSVCPRRPFPSHHATDAIEAKAFKTTTPRGSRRYNQRSSPSLESCAIPAGPLVINRGRRRSLPSDWREYIHPEGQFYFVKTWGSPLRINVVTEAYVYDASIRQVVSDFADSILACACLDEWHFNPESVELLIELDEEGTSCSYYFIEHDETVVFWLTETNTEDVDIPEVSGVDHLRIYLHADYWLHVEYFPVHRNLPEKSERDLSATLTHSCIDVITASTSTSPFDRSQLETILSVIENLKNTVGSHGQRNCIIARLWNEIYNARFINYFGERDARLYRSHIAVDDKPSSIFMKIIFLLLFDAPSTHLTILNELYIDQVLYTDGWRKFMDALLNDWNDMILWATVLLAANMSFLAIFNSTDQVMQENRAVTCSLVSTLTSTISIVIGLLHVRKHRSRARKHASDGSIYLSEATHPNLGLRPLAIVYSLPYAFLMWAMITFIAAILLFVFQSGVSLTSRVFISIIALCLGVTLVWVVAYFWQDELKLMDDFHDLQSTLSSLSPVALIQLVGRVAPRDHNPEAATRPIVRHWLHKTAEAEGGENTEEEGV
ncbi:hypothetical protein K439DRAFT_1631481 [Ramaria rubella]|nr:hypothetical protein K439DRAFT_1631481 [Ramaria rubella]